MICPRCGRPVNDTANFCGGCGLPKSEILKYQQPAAPAPQPVTDCTDELNATISQLENQLQNDDTLSVNDYTTEPASDTNTIDDVFTPSDFIRQEMKNEQKSTPEYTRPQYNWTAPEYPAHTPVTEEKQPADYNLSTVDYIWMMIIGAIPVVGLLYLLYTAFTAQNPNKRSYARAVLITMLFSCLIASVFAMGLIMSQLAFFYR